jgi:hypothetical protein
MSADLLGLFALLAIDRAAVTIDPRLSRGFRHAEGRSQGGGPIVWPRHPGALRIEEPSSQLEPRWLMYACGFGLSMVKWTVSMHWPGDVSSRRSDSSLESWE